MSITDIPAIAYPSVFGNNGGNILLDAAEEFIASVICIPKTGTLRRVGLRLGSITTGYTLKVSVETVAETRERPVATTNAGKTLYATGSESADITSGLTENTVNYIAINGVTGVSVTAGDLVTITARLIATESGGRVNVMRATGTTGGELLSHYDIQQYLLTYLGSSWTTTHYTPLLSLIYSDGFAIPSLLQIPCNANNLTYNSGSTYPYTGIKIKHPFKCRVFGFRCYLDLDGDAQVIVYDSDEYTVLAGPITLKNTQRGSIAGRNIEVVFPTKITFNADTSYRIIILPTSTTNIILNNFSPVDDATYSGYAAFNESNSVCLTQRRSAPTSGDHTWTDSNNKPQCQVFIDGIDGGASGSGSGISRSRQLMG